MQQTKKPFLKGFKYRIYPTQEQRQQLEKVFGCCRFVYNELLAESIKEYETYKLLKESGHNLLNKPNVSAFYFIPKVAILRDNGRDWLTEVTAIKALHGSAFNLASAYQKFFKEHKGFPNRKKKSNKQSATYSNQAFQIVDNRLRLTKFGSDIKVNWHRDLPRIKFSELSISKTPSGKYYVSIVAQYEPKKTSGTKITGVDLGIKDFATISDEPPIKNPRYFVRTQKQLKRAQQSLARKKKGSKNRTKARIRVAKIHERISNQRDHFLHNLSRKLVNENQVIGLERLNVQGMVRNRKLAKHIQDVSWSKLIDQIKYKAVHSQHCSVVLADPFFPSTQLCSCCGQRPSIKLQLKDRKWTCEHCRAVHHRDENASTNLKHLAEYEYYQQDEATRNGRVIQSKNVEFVLNNRPISIRSQPVEGSCAVRHPDEAGTTMLVELNSIIQSK